MPSLTDSVRYLKGVGEKRAKLYQKLGVDTIYSLLHFFPRTYLDYSDAKMIEDCALGEFCCVKATVFKKQGEQYIRKGLSIFKVFVTDGTTDMLITIYNSKYLFDKLQVGQTYCFYGKLQGNLLRREMNTPSFINLQTDCPVKAIYHLTDGLSNNLISLNVSKALELWGDRLDDVLSPDIKQTEQLCHIRYAFENIHFPKDMQALEVAKKRLIFEELFSLQLGLLLLKKKNRKSTGITIRNTALDEFLKQLPFTLTDAQLCAIKDGLQDFTKEVPMNRLLQGDVGSGKTVVACALAYCMANNHYQTAIMAPTEILAVQHYHTFCKILEPMGIQCALLTGSMTAKQKNIMKQKIAQGEYQIVIGTHALIQDSVAFFCLGLVITDEQHRFGVNQRAKLAQKGTNPHKLVMSATPIPRTLAFIIYGDLDVSIIDQPPKGRLPIKTYLITGSKRLRAYHFIKEHIQKGFQAYIVCPLIDEQDQKQQAHSVYQYAKTLENTELKDVRVGILHGKMKPTEKEEVMLQFQNQQLDLLISTTVIEVGVDVPNAVLMMIENAELFGLSQLHQLRGRVGRGTVQSHCILVSDHKAEQTIERLKIMTQSSDGFYISEQDLKHRGPGDFFGERQHGLPDLKIANMVDDMQILLRTQQLAKEILQRDADLSLPEHQGLKQLTQQLFQQMSADN